jgi:hypothetical protein
MPGHALHLRLAREVLGRWPFPNDSEPFRREVPACQVAFLTGSNAPDMGYYPGGDPILSDLAHYVRSADLARNLVGLAQTEAERAFAWGWGTHLLGDVWIHPLINRRAGQLSKGFRGGASTYGDDPVAHIRVETGLDGFLLVRDGLTIEPAERPGPDDSIGQFLAVAYRQTYGFSPVLSRVLRGLRAIRDFAPWVLTLARITGARFLGRPPGAGTGLHRLLLACVAAGTAALCPRSALYGLTHPLKPPAWLVKETTEVVATFTQRFRGLSVSGFTDLPNYNLDTGEVISAEPCYRPAARARHHLLRLLRRQRSEGLPTISAAGQG